MKTPDKRRDVGLPGLHGVARVDRRVPRLLSRLHPGDIAVIDVHDLDRSTADALVRARIGAVVNVSPSISGRYPTLGSSILVANEVPLLDGVGADVLSTVKEGMRVRLDGDTLFAGETSLARGVRQDQDSIAADLSDARAGLAAQLQAFAANTQLHMQAERELLLDGVGIPALNTVMRRRHVLLVARGYDYEADLRGLKTYIREFHPILVGVDSGADVLRDAGHRPDVVVGSAEEMGDEVLRQATDVVLHSDHQGRVRALSRVQDLGIESLTFATAGTSEDAAMLLADAAGAALVVTVGMRATLEEFLDSPRGGMASTVLTRLKVGGRVIDAKAAASLCQPRMSALIPLLVVVAAALAVVVVLYASTAGESYRHLISGGWDDLTSWIEGLFS